jgi:glyoxylate carboligase
MKTTAADILIDTLHDWGVEVVFGLPGDGINGIMEALRKRADKIRFIQVRHEESRRIHGVRLRVRRQEHDELYLATTMSAGLTKTRIALPCGLQGLPICRRLCICLFTIAHGGE